MRIEILYELFFEKKIFILVYIFKSKNIKNYKLIHNFKHKLYF